MVVRDAAHSWNKRNCKSLVPCYELVQNPKKKQTNKSTTHFLKENEQLCGGVWQSSLENKKWSKLVFSGGQPHTNAAQHGLTSVIGQEPVPYLCWDRRRKSGKVFNWKTFVAHTAAILKQSLVTCYEVVQNIKKKRTNKNILKREEKIMWRHTEIFTERPNIFFLRKLGAIYINVVLLLLYNVKSIAELSESHHSWFRII